jgi:hypothetical protein
VRSSIIDNHGQRLIAEEEKEKESKESNSTTEMNTEIPELSQPIPPHVTQSLPSIADILPERKLDDSKIVLETESTNLIGIKRKQTGGIDYIQLNEDIRNNMVDQDSKIESEGQIKSSLNYPQYQSTKMSRESPR